MTPIRIGGFFSGIGAHVSACERLKDRADFEYVFQCEFDAKTALAHDTIHGPIQNLGDITGVHDIGGPLQVDILYWTPPCQDISVAGKGAGNSKGSGTRSSLAYEVPRILAATRERERPKYLVMEEVPMMISEKFKANFDDLLAELSVLGYRHKYGILNAADCGVAQSRKRCFVVSKLNGIPPNLPKPIPLTTRLRDYLEPEPVAPEYYLSEERLKGLIWSNEKEEQKGFGYRFDPLTGERERESKDGHVPRGIPQDGQLSRHIGVMTVARYREHVFGQRGNVACSAGLSPTITQHGSHMNPDENLIQTEVRDVR